jgi:hypothetical protein
VPAFVVLDLRRNRANFLDPSCRRAIKQWPVKRLIHARIGQHMNVRHVGSFLAFSYAALMRLSIRYTRWKQVCFLASSSLQNYANIIETRNTMSICFLLDDIAILDGDKEEFVHGEKNSAYVNGEKVRDG